jgi:hypothetical protein
MMCTSAVLFGSKDLCAQQCPVNVACNPVFGSLVIPSRTSNAASRVVHAEEASPDGLFFDNIIALTYNRSWDRYSGSARDDITQPVTWLGLESYWNGNSELNIDLAPPNSNSYIRPFGWEASYLGTSTALLVGGSAYATGSASVELEGGTNPLGPLVAITDRLGSTANNNMLEMARQDGSTSFTWRAGGVPQLNFALQTNLSASSFGNSGVLNFRGLWDSGEPVLNFQGVGESAIVVSASPGPTDSSPEFVLAANGLIEWGSGSDLDTNLYRTGPATLATDGNVLVRGNLDVLGHKAALVRTPSYGQREVYALESPEEWFEDFGNSKLVGGRIEVRVDPVFGETVNTMEEYHVFLTADGECTLFVAKKETRSFEVRRLTGLRSCSFDYRIVARRRGYEDIRLSKMLDGKVKERGSPQRSEPHFTSVAAALLSTH